MTPKQTTPTVRELERETLKAPQGNVSTTNRPISDDAKRAIAAVQRRALQAVKRPS